MFDRRFNNVILFTSLFVNIEKQNLEYMCNLLNYTTLI